jgi:hypothetical protein
MKKFMLLHVGFEMPTPEIMQAWGAWFEAIAPVQKDMGGFTGGREISKTGTKDLSWNMESLTGFNVIEAENMAAAEKIASGCPIISSIRIYELR